MMSWLKIFRYTLCNLTSKAFFKLYLMSIGLSALLFAVMGAGVYWAVMSLVHLEWAWVQSVLAWLSGAGSLVIAWFLLPALLPFIASFFQDSALTVIETQRYPNASKRTAEHFWLDVWQDVRFGIRVIALNLLCLPLYLIPIVNIGVYYALNAHLLGKEFFIEVSRRYLDIQQATLLYRSRRKTILLTGLCIVFVTNLPIINLIAPLIAITLMAHQYHLRLANMQSKQSCLADS